ncbi:MAG: hypothetical protein QXT25_03715 [Candidatus Anstonellaceae archaeon]
MCIHCSFAISTGKRHIIEYCNPNQLTDEVPDELRASKAVSGYFEEMRKKISGVWKPVKTEFAGLKVEKLPMKSIGGICTKQERTSSR